MRKLLLVSLLAGLSLSCGSDPIQTKAQFPGAVAQAICQYYFTCCADPAQRAAKVQATTQTDCANQMTTRYAQIYQAADDRAWDGKAAQACVDKISMASSAPAGQPTTSFCPRGYDPGAAVLACTPPPILATKLGGDSCTYSWECKTQFCRQGTCHNPLQVGETCQPTEPCATGTACVNGACTARKPDGSSCTASEECISASCGGGVCVASVRYTCDSKL